MVIAGFSLMTMLLILLAGIGAGFVGYAVGASSLVSYPALLALGIPPVLANASNTVGVIGTGVGGVLGARKELRGQRLRSITYVSIGAVEASPALRCCSASTRRSSNSPFRR